jgi:hypothetical protein
MAILRFSQDLNEDSGFQPLFWSFILFVIRIKKVFCTTKPVDLNHEPSLLQFFKNTIQSVNYQLIINPTKARCEALQC